MVLVYIVALPFVMALFLALPLFPFWKVWTRMRSHHPEIWRAAGPFEVGDMIRSPGLVGIFVSVLMKMNRDADLRQKDPVIAGWTAATIEVLRFIPKGLAGQAVAGLVFFYATHRLARALAGF